MKIKFNKLGSLLSVLILTLSSTSAFADGSISSLTTWATSLESQGNIILKFAFFCFLHHRDILNGQRVHVVTT
ncbi:hypothetical protein BGC07_05385 [Piscirickettsia litoralis]|uniref:Uncharacterized protein n=1 Tax=Piscirickettsia litoralis TaxID=1891921 RepID=A0ABX3A8L2_9GAMM|nr:hypothetical protein BGC07_05385 [Piscirickettsia litoralis]